MAVILEGDEPAAHRGELGRVLELAAGNGRAAGVTREIDFDGALGQLIRARATLDVNRPSAANWSIWRARSMASSGNVFSSP